MFTVQGIEVLGTPLGTDVYIRNFLTQNCIKIIRDVEKLEPLTDDFTHFQLVQKTMNTRTQYMSANITLPPQQQFLSAQHRHVDTAIANAILKKGTRNSFHLWSKQDYDTRITIKLDRLIVLSKSSLLGWFLHVSLIVIIKGRKQSDYQRS